MSTTLRPDNIKAALGAKLAASMAQLAELREAEQPRLTPHASARELVGTLLGYARSVPALATGFGKTHAGDLQFDTWNDQWVNALGDADRALWKQLGAPQGLALVDAEIVVARDPSAAASPAKPDAQARARKRVVRFAAYPERAASDVCRAFVWLAKRYADDFLRDYARFVR